MFGQANVKMEYKEEAARCYSVIFQGNHFRPCIGLMHWVRWGRYSLDVRPLRKYLGLESEPKEYYLNRSKDVFIKRISEITDAVGTRNFILLNIEVNKMIEKQNEDAKIKSKLAGLPYSEDLLF
jgi:hypothetical protein